MEDRIVLSWEELNYLIREANDMGHYGKRVKAVYPLKGTASTDTAYAWDWDFGPTSATQTWENR